MVTGIGKTCYPCNELSQHKYFTHHRSCLLADPYKMYQQPGGYIKCRLECCCTLYFYNCRIENTADTNYCVVTIEHSKKAGGEKRMFGFMGRVYPVVWRLSNGNKI